MFSKLSIAPILKPEQLERLRTIPGILKQAPESPPLEFEGIRIPRGAITEISGPAGSGKTEWTLRFISQHFGQHSQNCERIGMDETGRMESRVAPGQSRVVQRVGWIEDTFTANPRGFAEHGLDPDTDIQIRVTPPPEMVANLRAGNIDGFLGPDPFNQRAVYDEVGFIHILSKEIWDGHPCCAFGMSDAFIKQNPNTYAALSRSVLTASHMASQSKDRDLIAKVISPAQYLNQPEAVLTQVLTGTFADGLGSVKKVPDRADFDPVPWQSMAVWMLTQMKRWGYIKGDVNYRQIAEKVFLLTDAKKYMSEIGFKPPEGGYRKFKVMGKEFDPAKPEDYLKGFAIHKMG